MNKRLLLAIAGGALLIAGLLIFNAQNATDDPASQTDSTQNQADDSNDDSSDDEAPDDSNDETNEDEQTSGSKNPSPAARVSEKPELFTSYGHNESNPVKQNQTVSTTCTTDANVDCTVTFSNGSQEISLDTKKTNADGVAFWTWIGGQDIPSGAWTVMATAGDKTSDTEMVYVQ